MSITRTETEDSLRKGFGHWSLPTEEADEVELEWKLMIPEVRATLTLTGDVGNNWKFLPTLTGELYTFVDEKNHKYAIKFIFRFLQNLWGLRRL